MVTKTERDRKNANAEFHRLMDSELTHLRVGQGRGDNTSVRLLMTAAQGHSLDGVCTCCPRRAAGEPRPIDHARAAITTTRPSAPAPLDVPSVEPFLPIDGAPTTTEQLIAAARSAAQQSAELHGRRE